jgi:hypothetical protein
VLVICIQWVVLPVVEINVAQLINVLALLHSALQYQLALFQIDSMRKDGRFVGVDGTIPEGQGIIMAHLNECHELVEMASSIKGFNDTYSSCKPAQGVHGRR